MTWTVCHINDIHLGSPRSYRFDPARNENWATARKQMAAIGPEFLLVGGDVTRDGETHEFEYELVKDDFETLPFPYHVIPGNMDVGNKHTQRPGFLKKRRDIELNFKPERLSLWSEYFGPINWSFVHRGVRFTGFYDAVAGSGGDAEAKMWRFLERLVSLPRQRHHVMMMHYALYIDRIDEPTFDLARSFDDYLGWYFGHDLPERTQMFDLFKRAGVGIVMQGHIHVRRPVEIVDGIRFYKTPAGGGWGQWENRWPDGDVTLGFHRLDVGDDEITVTFVPISPVTPARGYGPAGHPHMEERDYSLALDKSQPPFPTRR